MHYSIKLSFTTENKIFRINILIIVQFIYKVKQHVANNGIDNVPIDIKNDLALSTQ